MQHLFATLLSLLVSLCHHLGPTAHAVQAAEVPAAVSLPTAFAAPAVILPDRYQFARYTSVER